MRHQSTARVHWQGRQWAVTDYGIEALDGMYHVPYSEIRDADAEPMTWLDDLCRRYGTYRDDLAAALKVACDRHLGAGAVPLKPAA